MSTLQRSGHAVVLGASIGGLLAARVLSESYAKVTVFDRDELPTTGLDRKGVPQSEHPHGLLARGLQVLLELFPNVVTDLVRQGALEVDVQRDCLWVNDGLPMVRAESGLMGLCVSRTTLEAYIRSQVMAVPNVEIRQRHEAVGLIGSADRGSVVGATVLAVGGSEPEQVAADLVVDATGRGNRGPTWLAELGYDKPAEDRIDTPVVYMSRQYRRTAADAPFAATIQNPWPGNRRGAAVLAVDGDRWTVTLIGVGADDFPPEDPQGYLDFAASLSNPEVYALLSKAEPLTAPRRLRLPASMRRRYEKMTALPEGFVAIGDAICGLNPAYGQGMTVAMAEAMVLRDCVRQGRAGLPKRFFAAAAKVVDVVWSVAVGGDLRYPEVVGPRTGQVSFFNGYIGRMHLASQYHAAVGRRFLGVANLIEPPQKLFSPGILAKVLWPGRHKPARPAELAARTES